MYTLNVDAYLARIGAERPREITPGSLSALVRAHLTHVPFENLELTEEKRQPSLEPEALFEKVVGNRRGGYCFELNKLFSLLLTELGFSCTCVGVRCILGRPEPRPISHRGIVVSFGQARWYCDVGLGGKGPKDILKLGEPGVQSIYYERFQVVREDGQYVIVCLDGDVPARMLKFRDEPWLDVDFDLLNGYYAVHPASPFRTKRVLYRCTETGWISLVGDIFQTFRRGVLERRILSEEDAVRSLVKTEFGLTIPQWEM